MTAIAKFESEMSYESYIARMETMRINYQRMVASGPRGRAYLDDPDRLGVVRDGRGKVLFVRGHPGPMPIDLKAYVVARNYDPDKRRFPEVIAELVKHKHELHQHMRRYLLDQLRTKQNQHRKLAEDYQAVADQFEITEGENGNGN